MRYMLVVLMLCGIAVGQNAKVVRLNSEDAKAMRDLQAKRVAIEKQITELRESIKRKYLTTTDGGSCSAGRVGVGNEWNNASTALTVTSSWGNGQCETPEEKAARLKQEEQERFAVQEYDRQHPRLYYKSGWGCGEFEFTEDYLYIVPVTPAPTTKSPWSGITLTPATASSGGN